MKSECLLPERADISRAERLSFDLRNVLALEIIHPLSAMNRPQPGRNRWSV